MQISGPFTGCLNALGMLQLLHIVTGLLNMRLVSCRAKAAQAASQEATGSRGASAARFPQPLPHTSAAHITAVCRSHKSRQQGFSKTKRSERGITALCGAPAAKVCTRAEAEGSRAEAEGSCSQIYGTAQQGDQAARSRNLKSSLP